MWLTVWLCVQSRGSRVQGNEDTCDVKAWGENANLMSVEQRCTTRDAWHGKTSEQEMKEFDE